MLLSVILVFVLLVLIILIILILFLVLVVLILVVVLVILVLIVFHKNHPAFSLYYLPAGGKLYLYSEYFFGVFKRTAQNAFAIGIAQLR